MFTTALLDMEVNRGPEWAVRITITTAGNTHLSTCGLVLKTHETDLTVLRGV